jgi:general secretion pathway protein E
MSSLFGGRGIRAQATPDSSRNGSKGKTGKKSPVSTTRAKSPEAVKSANFTRAIQVSGSSSAPIIDETLPLVKALPRDVRDLVVGTRVLTATGGDLELSKQQQILCAILAANDGKSLVNTECFMLIARGEERNPDVRLVQNFAKVRGIKIQLKEQVDQIVLHRIARITESVSALQRQVKVEERSREEKSVLELFRQAAMRKVTDIHIIVGRDDGQIWFRSDGVMDRFQTYESVQTTRLWKAAFAMAEAGDTVANDTGYQDARITHASAKMPDSFPIQAIRVQKNPLAYGGSYIVMRLLYRADKDLDDSIESLGYDPAQIAAILQMMSRPFGVNIVCGPTGSGKSTTLQRILTRVISEAGDEGINVLTVEDPPEYEIQGARQLPVAEAKKASERAEKFQQAINAAMRSDPDIIMVGEIRDKESGGLVIQAAMTGHGVYATVHATDAMRIIDRLVDLGIEPYKVLDPEMVTGLIAQRLVRKVCPHCSVPLPDVLKFLKRGHSQLESIIGLIDIELIDRVLECVDPKVDTVRFRSARGCDHCGGRGAKGRTVVAETIVPDQKFMDLLKDRNRVGARTYWIEKLGGMTMLEHAKRKMRKGMMDPREIESVVDPLIANWYLRKISEDHSGIGVDKKIENNASDPGTSPNSIVLSGQDSISAVDQEAYGSADGRGKDHLEEIANLPELDD